MAEVEFHPDAEKYPYLQQSGKYGPGMEHPAECEIVDYQFPAKEAPKWAAKRGLKAQDFAFLRILVRSEEFGVTSIFHHEAISANSGSRLPSWLTNLGVPISGPPTYRHDPAQVVGRKCAVEVGEPSPRQDGGWFNGRLEDVIGVG